MFNPRHFLELRLFIRPFRRLRQGGSAVEGVAQGALGVVHFRIIGVVRVAVLPAKFASIAPLDMTRLNLLLDMLRKWQNIQTAIAPRFEHILVAQFFALEYFFEHFLTIDFSARFVFIAEF